jgi:cytochrome c-type protein NapB
MSEMPAPVDRPRRRHGVHAAVVAGVIALTVGLSGMFMGMHQTSRSSTRLQEAWQDRAVGSPDEIGSFETVPPAVEYAALRDRLPRPNTSWSNTLADLARPGPELARFSMLSPDDQEVVRMRRASRRLFDGAPPVSPHPLDQMNAATCLSCHGEPTIISGVAVPQMSHPVHPNCLQCHVSGAGPTSTWRTRPVSLAAGNSFQGKPPPGFGVRAYPGAPPVIPHATWMRQNCLTCHGPAGTAALRTSHPERYNCQQCHTTDARAEQQPVLAGFGGGSTPPPLPAVQ